MRKEAAEKYGITPVDTKWVDTDKAFEGEPMQFRSRMCAGEFKSDDRPDLYAGTPPLEALKAIISIAASHKETFSIMHIDVSRAYFHAKAQRLVPIRLPVEENGYRRWESWIDEEEHVRHKGRSQQLGARLARTCQGLGFNMDSARRHCIVNMEGAHALRTHANIRSLQRAAQRQSCKQQHWERPNQKGSCRC